MSRRTDIPAFYGEWFRRRVEAGWCEVPNPFNPARLRRVALDRDAVAAFVFWTRDPRPFAPVVEELEALGYPSVFLVTLTGYGPPLEPFSPPLKCALEAVRELAERLGPERVVWRYDPVVLGPGLGIADHRRRFAWIARALGGASRTVKLSVVDLYRKTRRRLSMLENGQEYLVDPLEAPILGELVASFSEIANAAGLRLECCAEEELVRRFGLVRGRCIDPELLRRVFGLEVAAGRDRGQRGDCACAPSVDIGRPDSCLHGCAYCYATSSHRVAVANHLRHHSDGAALF